MNYALIGSGGFISQRHKDAIRDIGGRVVLTCDIDPDKKADFTDYREMLKSPLMKEVDIISILTSNHLHAEHIRACLSIGKKVVVEKPLCINTDFSFLDGVYVVHQLHFHPLFNEICKAIRGAKKIKAVMRACRDTKEFWNSWHSNELQSGGVVYCLGSHIFDLLLSAIDPQKYKLEDIFDTNKKSSGKIIFNNGQEVEFLNEFLDTRDGQDRYIECDGVKYQLSTKDSLSFEGLHDAVLKHFEETGESNVAEAKRYIKLIDDIKNFKNANNPPPFLLD